MKFESKFMISTTMLALALAGTPALAQQPSSPEPSQPPASQTPAARAKIAQGELVRVDLDKKVIRIKDADSKEMEFKFTDATEVTGESKNVEGLATKTGTKVTIDYRGEGANMVATKIAIQAADAKVSPSAPYAAPSSPSSPSSPSTPRE